MGGFGWGWVVLEFFFDVGGGVLGFGWLGLNESRAVLLWKDESV